MKSQERIVVGLLLSLALTAQDRASEQGGSLRVEVNYTGTGKVDQLHKIFVELWDSPAFAEPNANVRPRTVKGLAARNGIVRFSELKKGPIYLSCTYDPTGLSDGNSATPANASVGIYGNAALQPEGLVVGAGESKTIKITFDDSLQWK